MYSDARRAALALFAMHLEDRAWVLERVDVNARNRLALLLRELDQLGFSSDSIDLPALIREERRSVAADTLAALARATPGQMEQLRESYGPELIAILAGLGDFGWKGAVSGGLGYVQSDVVVARWVEHMPSKAFEAVVAIGCDELGSFERDVY